MSTFGFSAGYRRIRLSPAEFAKRKKDSSWVSEYETRPSGNFTLSIQRTEYQAGNPPVGLILCADKGHVLAWHALESSPTKVMAANYRMVLPDAELLQQELETTQRLLESRTEKQPKKLLQYPGVPACRRRARGLRPALRTEARPSGFDP